MNARLQRTALPALCLIVGLSACSGKHEGKPPVEGPAQAPALDVSADRAGARASWILAVAKDSSGLTTLAQSNGGWGKLFASDPTGALAEFSSAVKSAPPGGPVRIGAARAALELAEAQLSVGALVESLTQTLSLAKTDAGGPEAAAWQAYVRARLAQRQGKDAGPALAKVAAGTLAKPFAAALEPGATGPLIALLAGKPEGAAASLPPGATPEYAERLAVRSLIAAGNAAEAIHRYQAVNVTVPDIVQGAGADAVTFRDPALADLGARVAALQALDALGTGNDWGVLLRARALLILGRAGEALPLLDAALKTPPPEAGLADLVLTDALSTADLKLEAAALKVRAQVESGDAAGAKAGLAAMPVDTIAHRVLKGWAGVAAGEPFDPAAFPEDRSILARALAAELDALGAQAAGAGDVAALGLVDRMVDTVERRFAEAAARGGSPEVAVKHLESAEDKAAAFAPSPRNSISALARAARENLRIGRPRVSLKYLTRLAERLPAVAAPADMLRDLLTIHAMERDVTPIDGQ